MSRLLLWFFFFAVFPTIDQSESEIGKYLESGDVEKIITACSKNIELELPGSKGVYDKGQAKVLLEKFFTKNPPKKYKVKHKGGNNEKHFFEIGTLQSNTTNYRTYFLFDLIDDKPQIIELRIEISD